eukprot:TRINITY_DN1851_c0_g1_i10.p1 TRINITY_DN1851_c0_g1~~TRINITY_DN1851_c0_g1_i10.p1  ORF type:complete len:389 (-),score=132.37 TRINITY_DN1851_c0_g1_i10:38-1204(-)
MIRYNSLGQDDNEMDLDTMMALANAHLRVLFAFTVNKNTYVIKKFFHWHVMDFLLAEVSLEHECYVMKGQFLEQETRAEEFLNDIPPEEYHEGIMSERKKSNMPNSLLASLRKEQKYHQGTRQRAGSSASSRSVSPNPRGWTSKNEDSTSESEGQNQKKANPRQHNMKHSVSFDRKVRHRINTLESSGTDDGDSSDSSDSSSDGLIATPPRKPPSFIKSLNIGVPAVKGGVGGGSGVKKGSRDSSSDAKSSDDSSDSSSDGLIATPPRKPPSFIKSLKIGVPAVKGGVGGGSGVKKGSRDSSSDAKSSDDSSDSSSDGLIATPPRKPPSFIKSLKFGGTSVKGGSERKKSSARKSSRQNSQRSNGPKSNRNSGRGKPKTNFQDTESER